MALPASVTYTVRVAVMCSRGNILQWRINMDKVYIATDATHNIDPLIAVMYALETERMLWKGGKARRELSARQAIFLTGY